LVIYKETLAARYVSGRCRDWLKVKNPGCCGCRAELAARTMRYSEIVQRRRSARLQSGLDWNV